MKKISYLILASFMAVMTMGTSAIAQTAPVPKKTVFPTSQTNGSFGPVLGSSSSISNAEDALTSDLTEHSTLNILAGVLGTGIEQVLRFPSSIPPNTVVNVKVSLPDGILSALPVISVQKMNGNNPVGSAVLAADLLSLISSKGNTFEIPITVNNETVNGVRIRFSPAVVGGFGMSMNVYGAYYEVEETDPANMDCSQFVAFGYTSGANQTAVGNAIGDVFGSVSDPEYAFDGDINTYATMSRGGASIAGKVYLNAMFLDNGVAGDQIRLTLSSPITILDVELLGALNLVFYDNNIMISEVPLSNNFIFLDLISLPNTWTVQVPTPAGYNRVALEYDNLLNLTLFDQLRVHDFRKLPAQPTLQGVTNDTLYAYTGTTRQLEAVPTIASDQVIWFDENNQQVATGISYTTPTINAHTTYKVLASRYNCILDVSLARNITILTKTVTPNSLLPITPSVNYQESLSMGGPDAAGVEYNYTLLSGTLPTGISLNLDGSFDGSTTEVGIYPISTQVYDVTNDIDAGVYDWEIEVTDPLNIHLLNFDAQWNQEQNALLTWETVGSTIINSFNVQHSTDAKTWVTIGAVRYQDAAVYHYVDEKAKQSPANFYRLELVEDFGNSYSKVVQLISDNAVEQPVIFPNPVHQKINIQHQKELTQVSVYNIVGQLVYSVERPSLEISLDHLSAGQYIIVITDQNGQVFQQKIFKK